MCEFFLVKKVKDWKSIAICLFLLSFSTATAFGQSFTVSGAVTDDTGEGMPGVNIIEKGTTNGTVTDVDGRFSFSNVTSESVLVFSFLGFVNQEITVGNKRVFNIRLSEDVKSLDEVVVVGVGYGTMRKSDIAGASVTVGEGAIKGSIITNIDQALQGRATGVTSVMTSGAPGSAVSIRIRGQATINSAAEPLYVVDGVIWQGGTTSGGGLGLALGNGRGAISPLSTLNPSDIVSMEILKDASATAIYGAQGSNGVVLITTRRGKAGEAKFSYDGMVGWQNQTIRLNMMNLREYAQYSDAIAQTTGGSTGTSEYMNPELLGKGTNWQDAVFRQALMHQHTLSLQGGTEKARYYVSGSLMNQEGTMIFTDFNRFSLRANLDADLKSWLKLGFNAMYSQTKENLLRAEGTEGILSYTLLTPPDMPVYDAYGNYASDVREGYQRVNPIAVAELDKNFLERQKLNGNIFLEVKPVQSLVFHTELGYDIGFTGSENWQPTYYFGPQTSRNENSIGWQMNRNLFWQVKNYLTYTGKIGKHSFTAMVGQEAWESKYNWQRINAKNLPDDVVQNPGLGAEDVLGARTFNNGFGDGAMASFFTRETYNFDNRYLFTYTFRYDGSSNFGPENRWAPFHSVAASWRFSNEKFLESITNVLSDGKIRLGWGQTGNQSINVYEGGGHWSASLNSFPTGLGMSYRQRRIANRFIQWETQEQWNLGLDLSFLKNRINLTVDAYDKTSKDMLMPLQLPSYFGTRGNPSSALSAPSGNYGTINNKGLEIALNTRNFERSDFSWSSDFQISFNKNKLVALAGTDASGIEGYGQWNDIISYSAIGGPLYEFYGYIFDGIYKDRADIENHLWGEDFSNGFDRAGTVFVGDVKYRDLNGDGKITVEDRTGIGSPLPKFVFGLSNTFAYKNFDLTVFVQGSYGNKIFNALDRDLTGMGYWSNQLKKVMDYANTVPIDPDKVYPLVDDHGRDINYWYQDIDNVTLSNPDTKMSRAGQQIPYDNQRISTRYIEDGSYLRIKNIVLGYTLPAALLRRAQIENVRIYANIQNLYTFTKYSGYDPEVGINPQDASGYTFGFDQGRYPAPRLISCGINVSF